MFLSLFLLANVFNSFHAASLDATVQAQLRQCERDKKVLCKTSIIPNEQAIDRIIDSTPSLKELYNDDYTLRFRSEAAANRFQRDSSVLCPFNASRSTPFNFIQDRDGWKQIAQTQNNAYTVFYIEQCLSPGAQCRNVQETSPSAQVQCFQEENDHSISVYEDGKGVVSRMIRIPTACKCKVTSKLPSGKPFDPSQFGDDDE